MTTKSVWELRELVGVGYPDSNESPGAVWLLGMATSAEMIMAAVAEGNAVEAAEAIMEEAAALVPVFTHVLWSVFTDLVLWELEPDADDPDVGRVCLDDVSDVARVRCFVVATRLLVELTTHDVDEGESP